MPARRQPVTSDSLFNLASVGKVFSSTLLALAARRGEVSLDDPVARYMTELQRGEDIRKVTLGQLASHTSGLHRTSHQYEPWHRGPFSLPDFIRYLNAWRADDRHEPGRQSIYSNTGFVLLPLALRGRFAAPIGNTIVDKNGGLDNTSTYIGMVPQQHLGIVILANRGGEPATRIGREIMLALANRNAALSGTVAQRIELWRPVVTEASWQKSRSARAAPVDRRSAFARPGQSVSGKGKPNVRVPAFAVVGALGPQSPHSRALPLGRIEFAGGAGSLGPALGNRQRRTRDIEQRRHPIRQGS